MPCLTPMKSRKVSSMTFHVTTGRTEVVYHENAAALFAHLGATAKSDTLLLESADIESKKNTNCMAILNAAARVTCNGNEVTVTALTPTGAAILERLRQQLASYMTRQTENQAYFSFPIATEHDERKRLQAISNVEVLRKLQLDAGYQGEMLPLLGGGFAFDYLETYETLPPVHAGPNTFSDYQFLLAESLLTIDHLTQTAAIEAINISAAALTETLATTAARIADFQSEPESPAATAPEPLTVTTDFSDDQFCKQVEVMQEHIYAGDIYQVVPARAFTVACPDAFAAYQALRSSNPSPYMFYLRGINKHGSYELFGASPESNLKFDAATRLVQLYPIAGTRPRGLNADGSVNHELDIRAELDMRTDAKEIAEHTMLVDLARNDLARVAVPATRQVADLLQVDRYSRVMHLVSRVTATLDADFDSLDAYRACMNMGTLTGAPKLKAIELLRKAETTRRGSYGGAVGYLRGDGSMDTCIVIRSAFVQDGIGTVQAGAGVVRDSQPQSEADETLHKAYAALNAIAVAQNKKLEVIR